MTSPTYPDDLSASLNLPSVSAPLDCAPNLLAPVEFAPGDFVFEDSEPEGLALGAGNFKREDGVTASSSAVFDDME